MDPFSNKSHINQKQKEFSTAMQIDSSPEPRTAIDFRASSDEDRSSKYNQSPREEAIGKLTDNFNTSIRFQ